MRQFKWLFSVAGLTLIVAVLTGCTNVGALRTVTTPTDILPIQKAKDLLAFCSPGKGRGNTGGELYNSIENYGKYSIGYVEYSDQGWEYNAGAQRKALIKKLSADMQAPDMIDVSLVNVVFIHGWHHSAHDDDCNVNEFRAMIHQLNADFQLAATATTNSATAPMPRFQFNGIYVAWRGESLTLPLLRQTSIFDRRVSAEHVAKGAVRELFADLRHLELEEEQSHLSTKHPKGRVRTIVVGHSFGAMIAFHSLSPGLINDLALSRRLDGDEQKTADCDKAAASRRFWPDMTILINPGFEASRFQAVNDVARLAAQCDRENPRPKLLVITAENDIASKIFFPLFRSVAALFEQYDATSPESETLEREANIHTVGFVNRFQTHRLELDTSKGQTCVNEKSVLLHSDDAVAIADLAARMPHPRNGATPLVAAQQEAAFTANAAKHLWVVRVPSTIVNGHDGFLYPDASAGKYEPYLLHWLVDVYMRNNQAPAIQQILQVPRYQPCQEKQANASAH